MFRRNVSLMVVLVLTLGCKDEPSSPKSKAPEDLTNVPADFTMTANDYYKDSNKDAKSHEKYYRKVVELSGKVSLAYGGHTGDGKPFFKLVTDKGNWDFIHCTTVDPQPWAKIVPGQQIKVKGRDERSLENCVIVDYGKDPSITISPEELTKEYQADPEATRKKYDEKYLRLEGDVVSLTLGKKGEIGRTPDKLVLKGNEGVQIECWFIGDFRSKEPENAQGQTRLKIVGMFKKDEDKSKVKLENCHAILP